MAEDNSLAWLAVLGPLVGAAVGAIWATFSPRSTQQRLKEALELEKEMPAEYRAEWRTHIDYLVANEAFNDRLVLQGLAYIALGYVTLALGFVTEGLGRTVLLGGGLVLIAVGAYRTLALLSHLRKERKRLRGAFPPGQGVR